MLETSAGPIRVPLRQRIRTAPDGRTGFVRDALAHGASSVLDIGTGEGWLVGDRDDIPRRVGVDTDAAILERAGSRYPGADFRLISGAGLPFDDGEFEYVVLSDVIEHVGDVNKQPVIDEAMRVLAPGGRFILTAPHAGVFSFLDPLDFKRRYPWAYRLYQRRSGAQPDTPVDVGHKHVTLAEIERLLAGRATVERAEYSGPFSVVGDLLVAGAIVLGRDPSRVGKFQTWEMSLPAPRVLASNLRLVAVRS